MYLKPHKRTNNIGLGFFVKFACFRMLKTEHLTRIKWVFARGQILSRIFWSAILIILITFHCCFNCSSSSHSFAWAAFRLCPLSVLAIPRSVSLSFESPWTYLANAESGTSDTLSASQALKPNNVHAKNIKRTSASGPDTDSRMLKELMIGYPEQ